ncbi:MAG: phosphatase PAP2 family protein [Clostridia bacterium]|nr:phosphatase PAP2 family protein [Clostridia bacterium]
MRKNQNQNQKLYALMLVMTMLCMLFAFPVSAQETSAADEVNTDAVLYVMQNPADGAVTDGDEIAKEEVSDGDAILTTGADEAGDGEEVFKGNTIGRWLDKTFPKIDYAVFTAVTKLHSEVMNVVVSTLTHLGDSEVAIPLLVACVIMCFFKKTRRVGITVAFAIVLGTLFTNVILKNVCGRVRPYVSLSEDPLFMSWYNFAGAHVESDNSFPSGHTTCAFEMGVALFLSMKKKKIAWIFPTLAAIVGFTRLYLCVHYFTDVVAGVIVGTFAAFLAYFIMKAITNAIENKPALRDFDLAEKIKGLKKA